MGQSTKTNGAQGKGGKTGHGASSVQRAEAGREGHNGNAGTNKAQTDDHRGKNRHKTGAEPAGNGKGGGGKDK